MIRALVILGFVLAASPARAGIEGSGDRIVHLDDVVLKDAHLIGYINVSVGFRYSYLSLNFLDLWHWGGEHVLYHEREYWVLDDELARAAGVDRAALATPLSYYVPSGLIVIAAILALGLVAFYLRRRRAPLRAQLRQDKRYRYALAQIDPLDPAKWTFDAAVKYLVDEGIDPVEARRNLTILYNAS